MEEIIKTTKCCSRCKEEKLLGEFYNDKRNKYGHQKSCACKECSNKYFKNYRDKPETREMRKKYRAISKNKERANELRRERYENNPEYKEKILKQTSLQRKTELYKNNYRKYLKKYRQIPHNRIADNLRGRINKVLKGINKSANSENLIGCSFEELKIHLEKQFKDGMNWENYGQHYEKDENGNIIERKSWHVDHIIPCAAFDLTKPEEQRKCFHYTNLQPLWAKENMIKGDRILNKKEQTIESLPFDEDITI